MSFNFILGTEETKFVESDKQITCHGHENGSCDLFFPHRMGSKGCHYNEDDRFCEACMNESCEYHNNYGAPIAYSDWGDPIWYDERSEALTVGERNPGLAGRLVG